MHIDTVVKDVLKGACRSLFANGRLMHAPLFHKISKYKHAIKRNAFLNVAVKLLFSVTGSIWCHYVYRCLPVATLFTMLATCFFSLLDSVNRCQFDDFLAFYGNQPSLFTAIIFCDPKNWRPIFIFMQSSSSHLKKFQDENFLPVEILMIFFSHFLETHGIFSMKFDRIFQQFVAGHPEIHENRFSCRWLTSCQSQVLFWVISGWTKHHGTL